MKAKNSKTPDKGRRIDWDEIRSSAVKSLKIIISLAIMISLIPIIIYYAVRKIPISYVQDAMTIYNNNSTMANMHISVVNNTLLVIVTFVYVVLTVFLVNETSKSVINSEKTIKQSKKEQQIRDIEKRLEKFYIPVNEILKGKLNKNHDQTINGWPLTNYVGLKDLRKYSYLAENETLEAYEKYITTNCKSLKSETCYDRFLVYGFYRCPRIKGTCMQMWDKCRENIEKCEHFNECPKKDQDGIIINNIHCKYYLKLKDSITKDIENYTEELHKLKK